MKNFRGIEKLDLSLKPGMNILIGDNGTGKTKTSAGKLADYAQRITDESTSALLVLMYMGISRVVSSKRSDFGRAQKNMLDDRRCGYIGCLDSIIDKNSILEWVSKMAYEKVLMA